MHSTFLRPCQPTHGRAVPATPHWLHEVKYDGYRLIVARDGNRVRLLTRSGYDWSDRFPWIVEAARKNRHQQFVIDGEAVLLAFHGISNFEPMQVCRVSECATSWRASWAANGRDLLGPVSAL